MKTRQALAAYQAVASATRVGPPVAEAVERQTRATRALFRRAFARDRRRGAG